MSDVYVVGAGRLPAKEIRDLLRGDRVLLGGGVVFTVDSIVPVGAVSALVTLLDSRGRTYTMLKRLSMLMACEDRIGGSDEILLSSDTIP